MEKPVVNLAAAHSLNLQEIFPFKLDDFQIKAIAALDAGKSVVVCAPTGSGKTLIGEYAIYRALANEKRVFYTTPLKALSNQKFRDFQERFASVAEIGLITGDILINPQAPIVIMTTEIFRNMLYETPIGAVGTSVRAIETVVLDECHYISDRQRGTVWEESIIYCPPSIQLVALSATIGNPEELTDWINQVRTPEAEPVVERCELINSDRRPVPLRFYFSNKKGLFPLLNSQEQLNPRLKNKSKPGDRRRFKREDCPPIPQVIKQLRQQDMLPAIYVIFSRRGCDQAVAELRGIQLVNEPEAQAIQVRLLEFLTSDLILQQQLIEFFASKRDLQQKLLSFFAKQPQAAFELLQFLNQHPDEQADLWQALAEHSEVARAGQLEPLMRGVAAHHAGILPAWKELVETLFELGLVKVVFATATLAAGINMPARTTVISSLSKRTDEGHAMLTPSEFLQIAGRAGRRGMDRVGHVVTVQTPFEGAKEAAYLATAASEPLRSWFTPSYGMVLNLLQKHTINEVKDLLERSFAEYLAQRKLVPEQQAIAELTTALAKLDVELAPYDFSEFTRYEKLRERLKEEYRLLEILQQQAEATRKREIAPQLPHLAPGTIVYLKGKRVRVAAGLAAVLVSKVPGSGQAQDLVCLGADNRWYVVTHADVVDVDNLVLPTAQLDAITLPDFELRLGRGRKANADAAVSDFLNNRLAPVSPEVVEQQQRVQAVGAQIDDHPLQQLKNPGYLIKRHQQRLILQERLHESQAKYQRHQSRRSYYWEEFLNLIEVLRHFQALQGFTPTPLGQAAATIRGENELWLGLALTSGALDQLQPSHLAAAVCALITETPRSDIWTDYLPSREILAALGLKKSEGGDCNLWEVRRQLNQIQNRYDVAMPVWLERQLIGLVEQWALGVEWHELCEATNLDEGDLVRMLRRTVDLLWQIPQIPDISETLLLNAKAAIAAIKRFPV